jgi:hypothetical protein
MTRFEFIIVLMSIIVGLGITELLTNAARQIQNRKTVKPYWMQSGMVAFIFIALLQQWWESWDLQGVEGWDFLTMMLMLAGPIGLFITAHLIFPSEMKNVDLREHYARNSRAIWVVAVFAVITATLFRPISFGHELIDPDNASSVVMLGAFILLALIRNRRFHEIVFPVVFGALVLDIFVFHAVL